jgi:hypothetical protein
MYDSGYKVEPVTSRQGYGEVPKSQEPITIKEGHIREGSQLQHVLDL